MKFSFKKYWQIRKQYRKLLKDTAEHINPYSFEGLSEKKSRLEELLFLKEMYLSRVVTFPVLIISFLVLLCFSLYFVGKETSTKIYAEIYVTGFAVKTNSDYTWEKYNNTTTAKEIVYNTDINPGNAILESDTSTLQLKSLVIPKNAKCNFFQLVNSDLNIRVEDSGNNILTGEIKIEKRNSIDSLIQFSKSFNDNVNFDLHLINASAFKINKLYIDSFLNFNENAPTNDQPYSGIDSGYIKLLDTNDEIISLQEGDSLKLHFKESPIKLNIQSEGNLFKLSFEAEVDQLKAGPAILNNTEEFNKMPIRLKTLYDKFPYVYAIIIAIIPFLIPLLFRPRRPL